MHRIIGARAARRLPRRRVITATDGMIAMTAMIAIAGKKSSGWKK